MAIDWRDKAWLWMRIYGLGIMKGHIDRVWLLVSIARINVPLRLL